MHKKEIDNSCKIKEELSAFKQLTSYELNCSVKNEEYYEEVSSSYLYGGYEEVFNDYSLDDLAINLETDDFKKLVKSGYHV